MVISTSSLFIYLLYYILGDSLESKLPLCQHYLPYACLSVMTVTHV